MKKGSHTVCHGSLRRRRRRRLCRSAHSRRRRGCRHNLTLHSSLKNQRRPHAHPSHNHHQSRVRLRLHLRAGIKSQRRHIHCVNRLRLLDGLFIRTSCLARIRNNFGSGRVLARCRRNIHDRRSCRHRRSLRNLQFAVAMPRAVAQRFDLPVRQGHIAALRYQHTLPTQLLFQSHRTAIRPHAHDSRALESHKKFSRLIANRHRLPLNLRRINAQLRFLLQPRMDRSAFQRHRHCSARFQNRKTRRPANRNLPAFHKANSRLPRLHPHIAPAPQNRFRHSANHFHAHRPRHGNVFAFDQSHRIAHWLVRHCRSRNKNPRANHRAARCGNSRAPQEFTPVISNQHSQFFSCKPGKKLSLYYTSRRLFRRRVQSP
jgi:hypothetical protein